MGSTRLPGKMLEPLVDGKSNLELLVERVRRAETPDQVVVATSVEEQDDELVEEAERIGVECYRGDERDVLSRVLDASREYDADVICRITGDCPLHDPAIIDQVISSYHDSPQADYVSNILERRWPRGFDTEVFSTETLERVEQATSDPSHREHVTTYIRSDENDEFIKFNVSPPPELDDVTLRVTLDYPEDLELIRTVLSELSETDQQFDAYSVVRLLRENPEIREINRHRVEA